LKTDEKVVRQLLLRLAKLKLVVQVAPDRFFLRTSLSSLAVLAGELAAGNPKHVLETAAFRDRIGAGRKVAIEILEFFDKAGITARRGDVRVVRQDGLARI
jgi:selenocysteine-specific elongation factor